MADGKPVSFARRVTPQNINDELAFVAQNFSAHRGGQAF